MSLKKLKEDLEKQIEVAVELEEKENENALAEFNKAVNEVDEPKEEVKEKVEEEKTEQEPPDPVKKAEPAAEKKEDVPEEPKKTPADYAKERQAKKREKDRLAEELAAAQTRIAALEAQTTHVPRKEISVDPEPNRQTHPIDWADWRIRQQEKTIESLVGWKAEQEAVKAKETLTQRAQREVQDFESSVRTQYPDYDQVKDYYGRMLMASIKIVNPKLTSTELMETTNKRLLSRASELLNEGYENPIEAMYFEAKALGYQPPKSGEEPKEEIKPDLKKVSNYRSRNAGMAGAAGSGTESEVTPIVAAKMTNAEFAKLKPEQKKRLFARLAG